MIFACASHLLVDLPLFGGPVVMIVGAVVWITRSEKKRAAKARAYEPANRSPVYTGAGSGAA